MCSLKPPFRAEDMEDLFKKVTKGFIIKYIEFIQEFLLNIVKI